MSVAAPCFDRSESLCFHFLSKIISDYLCLLSTCKSIPPVWWWASSRGAGADAGRVWRSWADGAAGLVGRAAPGHAATPAHAPGGCRIKPGSPSEPGPARGAFSSAGGPWAARTGAARSEGHDLLWDGCGQSVSLPRCTSALVGFTLDHPRWCPPRRRSHPGVCPACCLRPLSTATRPASSPGRRVVCSDGRWLGRVSPAPSLPCLDVMQESAKVL